MANTDDSHGLPMRIIGPHDLAGHEYLLRPRSDLTYRLFEDLEFRQKNLHQSLLTGTLLRKCTFIDCDLSRCDLDGMRIEDCTFTNCTFEGADIRSTLFSRCTIEHTDMSSSLIKDCSFVETSIRESSLTHTTATGCSFTKGEVVRCPLERSSWTLCRFERVRFRSMKLGDCTFLYMLMLRCGFDDVSINAESVGMIYGLNPRTLRELSLIYLGEEQPLPDHIEITEALLESYRAKRWNLGVMTLEINLKTKSVLSAVDGYLRTMVSEFQHLGIPKVDEIEFLIAILRQLRSERRLPLLTLLHAAESLQRVFSFVDTESLSVSTRQVEVLRTLSSEILLTINELLDDFQESVASRLLREMDRSVVIDALFRSPPELPLSSLLNELTQASGISAKATSRTVETRTGSFVEIVATTLFSLLALELFLFLTNGCIIQITELVGRIKVLEKGNLPVAYLRRALKPRQELPTALALPLEKLSSYVAGLEWLGDPNLKGYNPNNFKRIDISEEE